MLRPFGFLPAFQCTDQWKYDGSFVRLHIFQPITIQCGSQCCRAVLSLDEIFAGWNLSNAEVHRCQSAGRKPNGLNLNKILKWFDFELKFFILVHSDLPVENKSRFSSHNIFTIICTGYSLSDQLNILPIKPKYSKTVTV